MSAGPDRGWSWVVAVSCAYLNLAFFGLVRSSGVMYVAFLHNYGVTREEASWPFSLCSAVFQLTGPLASVLMHYLTLRKACIIGSSIATLGVVGCYFAKNITWVNIFYGVIHGSGFGLVATLIPMTIHQYFVRHRATAMGIAFSGGSISSFLFPAAIEFLLEQYDLPGTFLILGGVVMNTIVASCLLRAPPWLNGEMTKLNLTPHREERNYSICTSEDFICGRAKPPAKAADGTVQDSTTGESSCDSTKTSGKYTDSTDGKIQDFGADHAPSLEIMSQKKEMETLVPSAINGKSDPIKQFSELDETLNIERELSEKLSAKPYKTDFADTKEILPFLETDTKISVVPARKISVLEIKNKAKESDFLRSVVDILHNSMFYVLLLTINVFFMGMLCFFMIIVDYGKDKGIPEQETIYVLFAFSLTDLFGRLCLGWITDKGYVKAKHMLMANMAAIGILNNIYPIVHTLTGLMVVAALHGVFIGGTVTLLFVLQADYIGMKKLPLALGLTTFINGLSTFLRPPMIGLFRDVIGTYNWMFHFLGILYFLVTVIWLTEPWIQKKNKLRAHLQEEIPRNTVKENDPC